MRSDIALRLTARPGPDRLRQLARWLDTRNGVLSAVAEAPLHAGVVRRFVTAQESSKEGEAKPTSALAVVESARKGP